MLQQKQRRKDWTWPKGLADAVYFKIRKWFNQYDNTGRIHKSKRIPHERFGMELPDTKVIIKVHTIAFTYSEIKWLRDVLILEDATTSQSKIFQTCFEIYETKQEEGRTASSVALPFDIALTKDEVGYIKMLLECIGVFPKLSPSERLAANTEIEDWK